jgi:hypothetical protein
VTPRVDNVTDQITKEEIDRRMEKSRANLGGQPRGDP